MAEQDGPGETWAILTCVPDRAAEPRWGDTHFAAALAAALGRTGRRASTHIRPAWSDPGVATSAVVLHLRGRDPWAPDDPTAAAPADTGGSQRRVLWLISHPDDVTDRELAAYDLVVVASVEHARTLASRVATPVHPLLQAADLRQFRPPAAVPSAATAGIVVVANARWPYRRGPRWLDERGWAYTLHGANWGGRPESRHWTGGLVANDDLADVYAQADVVVADQYGEMSRRGFVANRLFDVAASGGFAITDAAPGVAEVFGDDVPTYDSAAELDHLLRHWLDRPRERAHHAHRAMLTVRRHHGFDHRVRDLLALLATA